MGSVHQSTIQRCMSVFILPNLNPEWSFQGILNDYLTLSLRCCSCPPNPRFTIIMKFALSKWYYFYLLQEVLRNNFGSVSSTFKLLKKILCSLVMNLTVHLCWHLIILLLYGLLFAIFPTSNRMLALGKQGMCSLLFKNPVGVEQCS